MTDKNLTIKLNIETVGAEGLAKVTAQLVNNTDAYAASIDKASKRQEALVTVGERLANIERTRKGVLDTLASAQDKLNQTLANQQALLDRNANNAGLAMFNATRGANKYESALRSANTELARLAALHTSLNEASPARAVFNARNVAAASGGSLGSGFSQTVTSTQGSSGYGGLSGNTDNRGYTANAAGLVGANRAAAAASEAATRAQATLNNTVRQSASSTSQATSAVTSNTNALRNNASAIAPVVQGHRNMIITAAEFVGVYALVHRAINLVSNALKEIPKAGIEMQATESSVLGIFGSERGRENIAFVAEVAERAGQNLVVLEQAYRRYAPSAVIAGATQVDVNKSFREFAEIGTLLHLPEEKINSLFLALDQMYAKGVVQSEEVKKQLGNVLPGAVEAFALSLGKTPAAFMAAMKANEVIAKEAVPKFAAYYREMFGGTDDTVFNLVKDRLLSNYNRMETAYIKMNRAIFQDTQETMNKIVKATAKMVESVTANIKGIEQGIEVLSGLIIARLAGAAFGLVVTNFALLGAKISAVSVFLTGMSAPVLAVGAGLVALAAEVMQVSFSYEKAEGFMVKYKDQQVSLISYLRATATVAFNNFRDTILDLFSTPQQGEEFIAWFQDKFSLIIHPIDTAKTAIFQFIAAKDALFAERSQAAPMSLSESYFANLNKLIEEDTKKINENTEARMNLAAIQDQVNLFETLNGASPAEVSAAISKGKLDALNYSTGFKEEIGKIPAIVNETLYKNASDSTGFAAIDTTKTKLLDVYNQIKEGNASTFSGGNWGLIKELTDTGKQIEEAIPQFDVLESKSKQYRENITRALKGALITEPVDTASGATDLATIKDKSNTGLTNAVARENNILAKNLEDIRAWGANRQLEINKALSTLTFNQDNQELGKRLSDVEFSKKKLTLETQIEEVKKRVAAGEKDAMEVSKQRVELSVKQFQQDFSNMEQLFDAIRKVESGGAKVDAGGNATSSKGARGPMQVMLAAWIDTGRAAEAYANATAAELTKAGEEYFTTLFNKYKDLRLALAAYNTGEGNLQNAFVKIKVKIADATPEDIENAISKLSKETREYVPKVLASLPADKMSNELISRQADIIKQDVKIQTTLIEGTQRLGQEKEKIYIAEYNQNKAMAGFKAQELEYEGKAIEAAKILIGLKYMDLQLQYQKVDGAKELLTVLKNQEIKQAEISAIDRKSQIAYATGQQRYNDELNKTNILVQTGSLSELEATFRKTRANKENLKVQEAQLKAEEDKLVLMQRPDAPSSTDSLDEQRLKIQTLKDSIGDLKLTAEDTTMFINTKLSSAFDNAFAGFISGSMTAQEAFKSFTTSILSDMALIIAQQIRAKAIGGIFDMASSLFSAGTSTAIGGGTTGGGLGATAGWAANMFAKGGGPLAGISSYSGTLLESPIIFPMAKGLGVAGEAGPEYVMPAKRMKDGSLGVRVQSDLTGGASSGIVIQNLSVTLQAKDDMTGQEQAEEIGKAIKQQLQSVVQTEIGNSKRSGGLLNPTSRVASF